MKNIVSISHWPLIPPNYGGAIRVTSLNNYLCSSYNLINYCISYKKPYITNKYLDKLNVKLIFKPKLTAIAFLFWIFKIPYGFICTYKSLLGKIPKDLHKSIAIADLIIIEEPHLFRWIYDNYPHKKYLLNEQNVEIDLVRHNYSKSYRFLREIAVKQTQKIEAYALKKTNIVTVVSQADKTRISKLYNIPINKIEVLSNGFNKELLNKQIELSNLDVSFKNFIKSKYIVIFVGSEHKPNQDALKMIENIIAPKCLKHKDIVFIIVGSVGKKNCLKYQNIFYTGVIDDPKKYMRLANIAINPMVSGSGTNIKMYEYLASGLPVISTKLGVRGLHLTNNEVIISHINDFYCNINNLYRNKTLYNKLAINGRKHVINNYSWEKLSQKYITIINKII